MSNYIYFNTTSGQITKTISLSSDDAAVANLNIGAGEDYVTTTSNVFVGGDTYYITNPGTTKDITVRPLLTNVASWNRVTITADGANTATFGNTLPNPTDITIYPPPGIGNIVQTNTTTGSFSMTSDIAGTYNLVFTAFPYQTYKVDITAV